jgi:5-methylthioribose kinase
MVPRHTRIFWDLMLWIVNEACGRVSATLKQEGSMVKRVGDGEPLEAKKSGLKAVTLIATLNPVSQVLW